MDVTSKVLSIINKNVLFDIRELLIKYGFVILNEVKNLQTIDVSLRST